MDISSLIAQAGGIGWALGAFVVALSVIVAIHEYGHYIVGRWCGIDAEVFSIGFGPVLVSYTDKRATRWQIAALPLGGYVKFLGDGDPASMNAEQAQDRARNTFAGAPLWARAAAVMAGPGFNFVFAIVVLACLFMARGEAVDPLRVAAVYDLPNSQSITLSEGDTILEISGEKVPPLSDFFSFAASLPARDLHPYLVLRDGRETEVSGPHPYPPIVADVAINSAAADVDIRAGDVVMRANDRTVATFGELQTAVRESGARPITLDIWRAGEELTFALAPRQVDIPLPDGGFETLYLVGITGGSAIEPQTQTPSVLSAIQYGVDRTWFVITASISGLWHVASGAISTCNISGPVGIAEASGATAAMGATSFVAFLAMLSAAIGVFNLFPVPVLDGGHLMFYAYEAVTGRTPTEKFLKAMMSVGVSLLMGLMVFAVLNDLFLC